MTATELVGCLQLASRNWRDLVIAGLQGATAVSGRQLPKCCLGRAAAAR